MIRIVSGSLPLMVVLAVMIGGTAVANVEKTNAAQTVAQHFDFTKSNDTATKQSSTHTDISFVCENDLCVLFYPHNIDNCSIDSKYYTSSAEDEENKPKPKPDDKGKPDPKKSRLDWILWLLWLLAEEICDWLEWICNNWPF